jgi:hypothetical protein
MEILGAAVGMVVGLAALAIALWEVPSLRRHFFSDYTGFMIAASALFGGWAGYWVFATLFMNK